MKTELITVGLLAALATAQTATVTSACTGTCTQQLVIATTDITPAQQSGFSNDLQSYLASFQGSPQYTALAIQLGLALPADVRQSIQANPQAALLPLTGTVDLRSLATAPPLTFTGESWKTYLGAAAQSSVAALQTSAALQIASIAQRNLGISQSISVPAATSSPNAAAPTAFSGLLGAAGVVVGAAAIFL